MKRLTIASLLLLLLVACSASTGQPDSFRPAPAGPLAWAPPQCGDAQHQCVDVYLSNTGTHQTPSLDDNTDYRIHLPATGPLVGGITITGGHSVQIIGGEIDLTYPCSNDASDCMGIYISKDSPGAVFVEGVWIRNTARLGNTCASGASDASQTCSTGDGIDVNTADDGTIHVNVITLENIRVDGISGCSGYGDHSDVFQPYQAPDDTIRIDRLTGVTNCQGLTLDPDLAYSTWHTFPASITVRNVNIEVTANLYGASAFGYGWWLTHGTGCQSGHLFLSNDYASEPPPGAVTNAVWPYPDCGARYSRGAVSWPGSRIDGSLRIGVPPGGDFVPVGAVGVGYRTPGYQSQV
jgi:hypothetical protein